MQSACARAGGAQPPAAGARLCSMTTLAWPQEAGQRGGPASNARHPGPGAGALVRRALRFLVDFASVARRTAPPLVRQRMQCDAPRVQRDRWPGSHPSPARCWPGTAAFRVAPSCCCAPPLVQQPSAQAWCGACQPAAAPSQQPWAGLRASQAASPALCCLSACSSSPFPGPPLPLPPCAAAAAARALHA